MMRTKIFVLLFFFSISIFAQEDVAQTTLLNVGDNLPSFSVVNLAGEILSSEQLKGKVVLINFWATWCPPCCAEFPLLQKDIFDKITDNDFFVLAISRSEKPDTVKKFLDKNKYTFPIFLDEQAKTYNLFASKYIPRNFVIGKDRIVKWASTGFKKEEFYEMIELIKEELKK
jgi:peroxiredoxin